MSGYTYSDWLSDLWGSFWRQVREENWTAEEAERIQRQIQEGIEAELKEIEEMK